MKTVFKKGQLTGNIQVLLAMTRVHAANWLRNDALVLLHFSLSPTKITKATQGQKQPCKTLKQSYKQIENQIYASAPPPHPPTHWCGERKKPVSGDDQIGRSSHSKTTQGHNMSGRRWRKHSV